MHRFSCHVPAEVHGVWLFCCFCPFLWLCSVRERMRLKGVSSRESRESVLSHTCNSYSIVPTAWRILHDWWYAPGLAHCLLFFPPIKNHRSFLSNPLCEGRIDSWGKKTPDSAFRELISQSKWRKYQVWLHEGETSTRHLQQHDNWCFFFVHIFLQITSVKFQFFK